MKNYSVMLPSYSVGEDVYSKIPGLCSKSGSRAVIIGGKKALAAAEAKIRANAGDIDITDTLYFGGEASEECIDALCRHSSVTAAHMIFAVGGGKALDTCKAVGELTGKPVYTFPTIASTCAAATAVSILYRPDGTFLRPFFLTSPPAHTFIDTGIIAAAPVKYMWAGIGDTLAKYYEARMSSDGEQLTHYHQLGLEVSRMCAEPVYRFAAQAVSDNESKTASYELEQTALAVIITTGIASILLTAEHTIDYNTGLAHAIFYSLTSFPQVEKGHLHGEVVGFGILILLLLRGDRAEFQRLYAFMKSVKLPVAPEDIELTEADVLRVVPMAASMPDVAHSCCEVTEEGIRRAFEELCAYNARENSGR